MKQINITDISLKEVRLLKDNDDYSVALSYGLVDENGKEYNFKNASFKDLNTAQKTKVAQIFNFLEIRLKFVEKI